MSKVLKTFYSFLFHYKKQFIVFMFVVFIASVLDNASPYVYKLLIDAVPCSNYEKLLKIIFVFVAARILSQLFNTLSRYLEDKVTIPASKDARLTVFRKIQDLDFAFHAEKNTGSLISAFKRGDNAFFGLSNKLNISIPSLIISFAILLFFFSRIAPVMALLMLSVFVLTILASWKLSALNLSKRSVFNKSEDKISSIITDNLLNYETVKFFAKEEKEENRLRFEFKDWTEKIWKYVNTFRLMDIIISILSSLGTLSVLWIAVRKLVDQEITTGELVMIISFSGNFYWRSLDLVWNFREIAKYYVDIKKYFSILDKDVLIKDPEKPLKLKNIRGKIDFENVGFSYPNGKQDALRDVNFHIKPGQSVAFVGRSGAGKTTIVKILLRFYDINNGKVLIDNTDIKKLTKSYLRSFIGVVPQEPILFNNTIGFNIGYGKDETTMKEIVSASKMANLYGFIETLPAKYETQVGERGIKLSGGQKQRLAIARMFLTNPKIIIFDEATSNLDSESEQLIQDALWRIAKNRTILIIAHRFSTVRKVDKIIVMENGTIDESGSHSELISKKGSYYHLWKLQVEGNTTTQKSALI